MERGRAAEPTGAFRKVSCCAAACSVRAGEKGPRSETCVMTMMLPFLPSCARVFVLTAACCCCGCRFRNLEKFSVVPDVLYATAKRCRNVCSLYVCKRYTAAAAGGFKEYNTCGQTKRLGFCEPSCQRQIVVLQTLLVLLLLLLYCCCKPMVVEYRATGCLLQAANYHKQ